MTHAILQKIITKEDQEKLVREIDSIVANIYLNKGEGFEDLMKKQVRAWVFDYLQHELSEHNGDKESYFKDLKKELIGMNEVAHTIAFEPTYDSLSLFGTFIKRECGEGTLITIHYDPTIIAGAKIVSKSLYRDYSVRASFDQLVPTLIAKNGKGGTVSQATLGNSHL
jgi:hypothetical protein